MSNLPAEAARSKVTVLRDDVEPGSGAESDYGFPRQWFHPTASKRHRIWAFVMVLPDSRHRFVRPVVRMVQHAWTFAHVGGLPLLRWRSGPSEAVLLRRPDRR